jgi:hypothetical protein
MSQVGAEDRVFFHKFALLTGLLIGSSGQVNVMDTLSRLSHDTHSEVAMVRY